MAQDDYYPKRLDEVNQEDSNIYKVTATFQLSLPYYKDKAHIHMFFTDLFRRLAQENTDERTKVKMTFRGCDTDQLKRQLSIKQNPFVIVDSSSPTKDQAQRKELEAVIDQVDKALDKVPTSEE